MHLTTLHPGERRRQPPMAIPSTDLIRMMTSLKTKLVDRRVHFDRIVLVHRMAEVVDRSSPWMRVACDHRRFQRRIQQLSLIIEPILHEIHRSKIYMERIFSQNR